MTPELPGWYPDPTGRFFERRWDGRHWASEVRARPNGWVRTDPIDPQQDYVPPLAGAGPEPGWHPDPSGRHWSRFWDGDRWRDWVDGSDTNVDPLGDRELGPPAPAPPRLTLVAAQPPRARPRRSAVWTGCAIVALWLLGAALTLWVALLVVVGPIPCGGSDEPDCGGSSPWPVLVVGFGGIALVTVLLVLARRRRGRRQTSGRWVADPCGRHEYRYWDGSTWTERVSDGGVHSIDPPTG